MDKQSVSSGVKSEKFFLPFVLLSLLLHFLVIHYSYLAKADKQELSLSAKPKMQERTVIRIIEMKKQVVDTDDSGEKRVDPKARFSGKEDMFFKKQTIAKSVGSFKKGGGKASQLSAESLQLDPYNQKAAAKLAKMALVQKPSPSTDHAVRSDHIEDIPLGDITQLNTSEYRFYGFLERFKKQMEGHWRLKVREFFEKNAYGRIPASQSKFATGLIISLDAKGQVIDIDVDSSSGVQEVDEIAISAINKVGAFPNPPQEMVVDGKITIPFGFVLN